jgi:hypothetical protein
MVTASMSLRLLMQPVLMSQARQPTSLCSNSRSGRSESRSQHCLAGHDDALQMKMTERTIAAMPHATEHVLNY